MTDTPNPARQPKAGRADPALAPPVDVIEDAGGITLRADLPGVPRDRLCLEVDGDTLTIEGEIAIEPPEGMDPTHIEVDRARFHRAFSLSKELDTAHVKAELVHGVLTLRIPKAAHAQPRRVAVRVD